VYAAMHGSNNHIAKRVPFESELFGLKIAPMVLPTSDHRIESFKQLRSHYDTGLVAKSENTLASMGAFATCGFLILVLRLLTRRGAKADEGGAGAKEDRLLDSVMMINIFAVLLGTVGGFGSLFNHLFTPQFRCYNRISIFIAFLSIIAI